MSATTELRPVNWLGHHHPAREGVPSKALRGTKWKPGWLMVGHNDRLMPYPELGFDNTNSINNGGPLSIAGADANGGIRVLGREGNLRFAIVTGGTVPVVTIAEGSGGFTDVIVTQANTTIAKDTYLALQAHARSRELVQAWYTGTGAGVAGTQALTPPPWVRVVGVSRGEVDASDSPSADVTLDPNQVGSLIEKGLFGMYWQGTLSAPGQVLVCDNQTVQQAPFYGFGCLSIPCEASRGGLAFCRV